MSFNRPSVRPFYDRIVESFTDFERVAGAGEFQVNDRLAFSFENDIRRSHRYQYAVLQDGDFCLRDGVLLRHVSDFGLGMYRGGGWMVGTLPLAVARSDDGGRPLDAILVHSIEGTTEFHFEGTEGSVALEKSMCVVLAEDGLIGGLYHEDSPPQEGVIVQNLVRFYWSPSKAPDLLIQRYAPSAADLEASVRRFLEGNLILADTPRVRLFAGMVYHVGTAFQHSWSN